MYLERRMDDSAMLATIRDGTIKPYTGREQFIHCGLVMP